MWPSTSPPPTTPNSLFGYQHLAFLGCWRWDKGRGFGHTPGQCSGVSPGDAQRTLCGAVIQTGMVAATKDPLRPPLPVAGAPPVSHGGSQPQGPFSCPRFFPPSPHSDSSLSARLRAAPPERSDDPRSHHHTLSPLSAFSQLAMDRSVSHVQGESAAESIPGARDFLPPKTSSTNAGARGCHCTCQHEFEPDEQAPSERVPSPPMSFT